jgi:hypothetical protein
MRHFCSFDLIEVTLLSHGVANSTRLGALILPSSSPDGFAPRSNGARLTAISIAVIAPAAQEEHLPATRAGNEA